jgi:hypothetical protein
MGEDTRKMNVGDTLTLSGKSKHGKNRVNEQGAKWTVIELKIVQHRMSVFPVGTPITLLAAVSDPTKHWRWIRQQNDVNFNIEAVETK